MKKICQLTLTILFSFVLLCFGGALKTTNTNASAAGIVTITFNPSGGECPVTELSTTDEGKLTSLPEASKDGCFFNGWYTEVQKINKVTPDTVYDSDTMLYAGWAEKTFSYTITKNSGSYTIEGHTTVPEINYPLATNLTNIEEVFETISNELPEETTPVTLDLTNISLSSQLEIPFTSFTLSGNLDFNVSTSAIKVAPTHNLSKITFKNLNITGSCENYIDFVTTSESTNITFNNCNFSANCNNDYGLNISSSYYSITFDVFFCHTSKYLMQYVNGLKVFMETALADGSKIVETTHISHWRTPIINKFNKANLDNYTLLPLDDYYDFNILTSDSSLRVCPYIKTTFELNGGSFAQDFTPPKMYYMSERPISLPVAENIEYAHHNFLGWITVIEFSDEEKTTFGLNSNIYYLNKRHLQNFKNINYDISTLDTLTTAGIPETSAEEFFTTYNYYANPELDSLILKMFNTLKKEVTFLALYEDIEYSINFVTNNDTTVDSFTGIFDTEITFPTLSKVGYDFAGWYEDENFTTPFTQTKLSNTNPTIYAKWLPKTYQLTIHHNDGTTNTSVINIIFGDTIIYPEITYTGHMFVGYFEDANFTTEFTSEIMPSRNVELYIKWNIKQITVYFETMAFAELISKTINYGKTVSEPPAPNNPGYNFLGWYTSQAYTTEFDFSIPLEHDIIIYARWIKNQYTITFNSNGGSIVPTINKYYHDKLETPITPIKKGYKFLGWFTNSELTETYTFTYMPDRSFTLYAKWLEKENIQISDTPQSFKIDEIERNFITDSQLSGFIIKYFVNGEWVSTYPVSVGNYDVKIYRPEDDNYAEFSLVIKNGYVLTNKVIDILWIAIILYIIFVIEIGVVIFIKKLRKKKLNDFISLSITLPIGVVSTSQFVMVIAGAVLALFGFILVIYELVKLHRTLPGEYSTPSEFDNTINVRKIVDKSEDKQIDSRVDDILKSEFSDFDFNNTQKSDDESDIENENIDIEDDDTFNND